MIRYGDEDVFVLQRDWLRVPQRLPYRKTYRLKPGEEWHNAEVTIDQWEHYVQSAEGPLPIGAVIARELISDGATSAAFTDCGGTSRVLLGPEPVCVAKEGEMAILLERLRAANGHRWAGLPDVIAFGADGKVVMREAKVAGKDRLSKTQHAFGRGARSVLGERLDLAVVEWGKETASGEPCH